MYDNWNEDAIRIIMHAQQEGRRMGYAFIGTEQLFLGLIADGSRNQASRFLKEKGFNLLTTRSAIQRIVGRGSAKDFIDMPFTPRMRFVIKLANELAENFKDSKIGPEHLLLALFLEGEGVAMCTIEPSLKLKLHQDFKSMTFRLKGALNAERPKTLDAAQLLFDDLNDVLTSAHKRFVDSIEQISQTVSSANIATYVKEPQQVARYMISGTRVVNCTVNEDEIKALGNQGIATYESKQEACLALIDWLTFEIQIATQDIRQLGGASGS